MTDSRIARIHVGTAGWNLPREWREHFVAEGTQLERYASRLSAVEINSSFYRPHRPTTYARWAASVPADFRFAVKVPKAITHGVRLVDAASLLDTFLGEASALGDRLGCLLVQLPPSLAYDARIAESFFVTLRERYDGAAALEPRHRSWFTADADAMLIAHRVARVAADPALAPSGGEPGGWPGLVYHRLHGSPRVYYSDYDVARLDALADQLRAHAAAGHDAWCIFDNTALGAATGNALHVHTRLGA